MTTPTSEGYISDEEEESDDDVLEVVESLDILEEEGVYLTGEARRMSLKVSTFNVLFCLLNVIYSYHLLVQMLTSRSKYVPGVLKSFLRMNNQPQYQLLWHLNWLLLKSLRVLHKLLVMHPSHSGIMRV